MTETASVHISCEHPKNGSYTGTFWYQNNYEFLIGVFATLPLADDIKNGSDHFIISLTILICEIYVPNMQPIQLKTKKKIY